MTEPDFRSDRSESAEGKGRARQAWDIYAKTVTKTITEPLILPLVEPAARVASRAVVADLIGFWVLWHLEGGFEGMQRIGCHRATVFRKVKRFRQIFGVHPDEYEFPGVTLDPEAYWEASWKRGGGDDPS